MRRLIQWIRERVVAYRKKIFNKVINTKIGYAVVGILIASSFTISFYEGKALYEYITTGLKYSNEILIQNEKRERQGGTLVYSKEETGVYGNERVGIKVSDSTPQSTSLSIDELADYIHLKESSCGVNNYSKCKAIGKYNEYGYGIKGDGKYICFNKGEDRKSVIEWIKEKKEQGMSDKELLCYYNTGEVSENCNYLDLKYE